MAGIFEVVFGCIVNEIDLTCVLIFVSMSNHELLSMFQLSRGAFDLERRTTAETVESVAHLVNHKKPCAERNDAVSLYQSFLVQLCTGRFKLNDMLKLPKKKRPERVAYPSERFHRNGLVVLLLVFDPA